MPLSVEELLAKIETIPQNIRPLLTRFVALLGELQNNPNFQWTVSQQNDMREFGATLKSIANIIDYHFGEPDHEERLAALMDETGLDRKGRRDTADERPQE